MNRCDICGKQFNESSNDAWPVKRGRCCDECDCLVVIPERMRRMGCSDAEAKAVGEADLTFRQNRKATHT